MSRQQIHSPESEGYVLSCLLLWPETIAEISSVIGAADFFAERNRLLFAAFKELDRSGKPIDFVTVFSQLQGGGDLDKVGADYITGLMDATVTTANAAYHAGIVRKKCALRRLADNLAQMAQACATADDLDGHLAACYQAIESATDNKTSVNGVLTIAEMADLYTKHVSEIGKNRFKTGLEPLDDVIKGVCPGETLFITAYSGLYKSALLQNILLNGCRESGQHHLFFSMEMPATRVFERTVQIGLGRYTYNIESEFHHHEKEKRAATMLELAAVGANRLLCCETPGLTLEKIEHYTRQARSRHGKIGAIGLDYLGLMAAEGTRGEYERISKVAEDSKQLAKRLNIPVIVLTQISRSAVTTGEIEMHSAKGSGAIEASADYMLGMKREKSGEITLKLLKNRNGEAGATWQADIRKDFLQFRSLTAVDSLTVNNQSRGNERKAKATAWHDDEGPAFD